MLKAKAEKDAGPEAAANGKKDEVNAPEQSTAGAGLAEFKLSVFKFVREEVAKLTSAKEADAIDRDAQLRALLKRIDESKKTIYENLDKTRALEVGLAQTQE